MPQAIDPEWLGERFRRVRKERELTLQAVADQTAISVPTLSRIERGEAKILNSDTLVSLADWMGTDVEQLLGSPPQVPAGEKQPQNTPDIVELHLRADKKLDSKTATALAGLFRSVYDQVSQQQLKKR